MLPGEAARGISLQHAVLVLQQQEPINMVMNKRVISWRLFYCGATQTLLKTYEYFMRWEKPRLSISEEKDETLSLVWGENCISQHINWCDFAVQLYVKNK